MSYLVFSLIQATVLFGVESSLLLLSWSGSILFAHGPSSCWFGLVAQRSQTDSEDSSWATWRDIKEKTMVWYWHFISPVLVLCENTTCRDPKELKSRWVPQGIPIGRYMSSGRWWPWIVSHWFGELRRKLHLCKGQFMGSCGSLRPRSLQTFGGWQNGWSLFPRLKNQLF